MCFTSETNSCSIAEATTFSFRATRRSAAARQTYAPADLSAHVSLIVHSQLLSIPDVVAIAARHHKTPAQVLLRWSLQRGVAVIPKSATPERMRENLGVYDFALSTEDMETLGKLDQQRALIWTPYTAR